MQAQKHEVFGISCSKMVADQRPPVLEKDGNQKCRMGEEKQGERQRVGLSAKKESSKVNRVLHVSWLVVYSLACA